MIRRVAIIHPWFPQYRIAVFERLIEACAREGIQIDIFHGDPPPEWAGRGDAVINERLATRLPTFFVGLGKRHVSLKAIGAVSRRAPYDLIILEHAIRNIETYWFLARWRSRSKIAWWGHGRTYTAKKSGWEERFKRRLTRHASWFFSYTPGGAEAVISSGFPTDRVTVLNNAIDAAKVASAVRSVSPDSLSRFAEEHDLGGSTGIFIGGLDASKRIDFLLEASAIAHEKNPSFRLVIVGDGEEQSKVRAYADQNRWCVYLGPLFADDRAVALRSAQLMLMPGRVGLAAVDSFASETPIVTTRWPFHAPEFEYLRDGENSIVCEDSPEVFADRLVRTLADQATLDVLTAGCRVDADKYTVDAMVENFTKGIREALKHDGNAKSLHE